MVTDGLPGVALAAEPAEKNIMEQAPRPPDQSLFAGGLIQQIVIPGILMASAAFVLKLIAISKNFSVSTQQTMIFTMLCIVQLGNALSVRTVKPMFKSSPLRSPTLLLTITLTIALQALLLYVPLLRSIFKIEKLSSQSLLLTVAVSLICVVAIELSKMFVNSKWGPGKQELSPTARQTRP
ncbi:cation transporting ATPase C-terminal domain-containing protein [Dyadobacter sp. CY312]|uniref:cation transporting ATPase C-terminal domain-containing protein n=1 Tax=Dyadobacter sp. CY312 TaxID=2907303 RepID=UPI001F371066|nr:cation-translocating P-type ATPase C-terminal domain-containing protein [Dyadobacter sp. CY312]MCE7041383.1 cation-translocating P-type ATPase C-terminal domain-containing protein [Dyadobacter sp. CY312]